MDSSLIVAIISSSATALVGIFGIMGSIWSAKINSRQKENEAEIKDLKEKLTKANIQLDVLRKKEDKYLDIIKEWSADSKKKIREDVEKTI